MQSGQSSNPRTDMDRGWDTSFINDCSANNMVPAHTCYVIKSGELAGVGTLLSIIISDLYFMKHDHFHIFIFKFIYYLLN